MVGTGRDLEVRVEPCTKRLRAYLGGIVVFDTVAARMVWEVPYYPQYYVPRADVRVKLEPTGHRKPSRQRGDGVLWNVVAGDYEAVDAAATYDDSPVEELHGLVWLRWDAMDAWFEEDEEVFTHPRSPYRRVDILPTSRHVRVETRDAVLAESTSAHVLFETGLPPRFYLPKVDVRMDLLEPSDTVTHCPHKGETRYWSLLLDGHEIDDVAWSYPYPLPESTRIAGLVSFESKKVDVVVDGVRQD
ncbi:MAG TPA: DUF427 domain-containing protein [Jiangellaceae bacterium]